MDKYLNMSKIAITYLGGIFTYLLGGYDHLLRFLLILMVVDFFTGFFNALINGNVDPNKMLIGGIKKIAILLVVAITVQIDLTFNEALPIREMTLLYYIIQEFTSFTINISLIIDLPEEFTKYFEKTEKYKENEELQKGENEA